jgi:hypothetical protein
MAENDTPIRTQAAVWSRGGLKSKAGTLLLYPDKLVHVSSTLARIGRGLGGLGILASQAIASARAPGKVAADDPSDLSIPLTTITEVVGQDHFARQFVTVRTIDGDEYRFGGVKVAAWLSDLSTAVSGVGGEISQTSDGFSVTGAVSS